MRSSSLMAKARNNFFLYVLSMHRSLGYLLGSSQNIIVQVAHHVDTFLIYYKSHPCFYAYSGLQPKQLNNIVAENF